MAPATSEGALKKSRFTEEQMVTILREADRSPVTEVAKYATEHLAAAATRIETGRTGNVVLLSPRFPRVRKTAA